MFMIVKQVFCTLVEAVTEMSFTGQKTLWEAPTAMYWLQACKQSRRFYLNKMDFGELMEKGVTEALKTSNIKTMHFILRIIDKERRSYVQS